MRPEPNFLIDRYRAVHPTLGDSPSGSNAGYFVVPVLGVRVHVISSGTDVENGWEHVSVSHPKRCPTWNEMQQIKELFWTDHETVVQFHPKKSAYINRMEFCLHMWRPLGKEVVLPPLECV